jgi:taurine dioxygenase
MLNADSPLPGLTFGCTVRGLALADLADEQIRAQLRTSFIDAGLMVFRDSEVTDEFHLELSRMFGELSIHPLAANLAVADHPELIALRYEREDETIFDVDGERLGSYVPWHFDGNFVPRLNRGGILRVTVRPEHGGNTAFIDGIDAYQRLPRPLRDRIEGLEAIYQLDGRYPFLPRNTIRIAEEAAKRKAIMARKDAGEFPPVAHPIVITQAETGRKVLHFSPMFAQGIVGLRESEAHELLVELAYHVTDESRAYVHHWKSSDELVLWDNWRVLHKACGVPPEETRTVVRTTIAGDYGLGRELTPATASAAH